LAKIITQLDRDAVSPKLMAKLKPSENGRLEVAFRIYKALCDIPVGDLSAEQKTLLGIDRRRIYEQWVFEGNVCDFDGLQGKRGFAAIRKEHIKQLEKKAA
jgi:hypothetical protein